MTSPLSKSYHQQHPHGLDDDLYSGSTHGALLTSKTRLIATSRFFVAFFFRLTHRCDDDDNNYFDHSDNTNFMMLVFFFNLYF